MKQAEFDEIKKAYDEAVKSETNSPNTLARMDGFFAELQKKVEKEPAKPADPAKPAV